MIKNQFNLVVKTMAGLEEILAGELKLLGADRIEILNRAVKCRGDQSLMYNANYRCRYALRVLKEISAFSAKTSEDLYDSVRNMKWDRLINSENTIAVNAVVSRSEISHSHYASLKVKDAVVDYFRDLTGKRPSVDVDRPDLRIHVHIFRTKCTILLDSSGDSLHKRGYRRIMGEAPINEVLAAGMIGLSGWDGNSLLLDPMCGSGTILIEAAMLAQNMPGGYYKKYFAFTRWNDFNETLWKEIKAEADSEIKAFRGRIVGADVNQRTLFAAGENLAAAGLSKSIELKQVAFEDSSPPDQAGGFIITNPPYGERIKKKDLFAFYQKIGDTLKQKYRGYTAWIITSDFQALKHVGLRPTKKLTLFNGPLACKFVKYEMYSGSRRQRSGQT